MAIGWVKDRMAVPFLVFGGELWMLAWRAEIDGQCVGSLGELRFNSALFLYQAAPLSLTSAHGGVDVDGVSS